MLPPNSADSIRSTGALAVYQIKNSLRGWVVSHFSLIYHHWSSKREKQGVCSLGIYCVLTNNKVKYSQAAAGMGRVSVQVTKSMLDAHPCSSFLPCYTSAPTPNPTPYCSYPTLKDIL